MSHVAAASGGSLGEQLTRMLAARAKGAPAGDFAALQPGALSLLEALQEAYSAADFQGEVRRLEEAAAGNEVKFLMTLGPAAARVQAPVFAKFGLPAGARGVMIMKMSIKMIAETSPRIAQLAGDLRELLRLPREEEEPTSLLKEAENSLAELAAKIERAPLDIRGPLAEALALPYKAAPREIAAGVRNMRRRAEELADLHMSRGRATFVGEGKMLSSDLAGASDDELRRRLVESFERYLQKMVARVITPLESFTKPPAEFSCSWAEGVVEERHARELWGPQPPPAAGGAGGGASVGPWLRLGVGVSVQDGALGMALARRAQRELEAFEAAGELSASRDPCNVGARSVWLHFETPEERARLPPALREVCLSLAGLPAALEARAAACGADVVAPRLRVHPHVLAATYRRGAEYHCHKDSYDGADNQRMLTVLMYLNDGWEPGDDGELRVFGSRVDHKGARAADEQRYVDIAPLSGRLVMFRSREVWHAVREPREQRWALTLWVMAD